MLTRTNAMIVNGVAAFVNLVAALCGLSFDSLKLAAVCGVLFVICAGCVIWLSTWTEAETPVE